jgi:cytochrome P450
MTTQPPDLSYDPYDVDIHADPYPVFRRLREEAPLYYNARYDFYAISRFHDVERGFADRDTYISGRGSVLEAIQNDIPVPPGFFIFEDPPTHTVHRGVVSRVFTPKRMNALEPQIRGFCAHALDQVVGAEEIDFVADLGAQMPMRVIGMLLGIPEADQEAVRNRADAHLRTEPGQPRDYTVQTVTGEDFAEYIDWRVEHPSDDLMTELIRFEFEDETGTVRRLTREEILVYTNLLATAGNETTNRLIGWIGKLLSDHPDQRRRLVADRSGVPNAIEEILRFEPPAPHIARCTSREVEMYGDRIPQGSAVLLLVGAANRDDRRFPDGERFDIQRRVGQHLTFAYGAHFCLGAALARLEGRVALEELLDRFPDWEVDASRARLASTSTVRGWETLPATIG